MMLSLSSHILPQLRNDVEALLTKCGRENWLCGDWADTVAEVISLELQ